MLTVGETVDRVATELPRYMSEAGRQLLTTAIQANKLERLKTLVSNSGVSDLGITVKLLIGRPHTEVAGAARENQFGKILADEWTFQDSSRLKLNLDDSDKSSAEFAGVVHWVHTPKGRAVFPALELVADVPFERGTDPELIDSVQFSVIPQLRIGLNKRGNIALNTRVELPLNDSDRYEWRAYMSLIWDFAYGGFFEGW